MPYFAAALASRDHDWHGAELDLDDIETLDDIAATALGTEPDNGLVIVCVEADEWFGLVRVDEHDEPRAYVSDAHEAARTSLGEILMADANEVPLETALDAIDEEPEETEEEETPAVVPPGPVGEPGLLDDVGVGAADLQVIATKTGLTPADAIGEIATRLGASGALEELR